MTEEKPVYRDIPLGVFFIVLAQFPIFGIIYLAGNPQTLKLFGIIVCAEAMGLFIRVGISLLIGEKRDNTE
jgi:hypothetical protein